MNPRAVGVAPRADQTGNPLPGALGFGTPIRISRYFPMPRAAPSLSLPRDYLARLIVKTRAVQAREGEVDPQSGSNPTDDQARDALQDSPGDLSREEVREELQGLDERQQAELVALMWIGRGDAEPEEWEATLSLARERRDSPTPNYLLRQPLVGEHWEEGAVRLGIDLHIGETLS